jgi:DNA mismatch repair protein MSH4
MLWSFAHCAILRNYTRPEFTGVMAVKSGRHPILETIYHAAGIVPNDVFCNESSAFQLIQGPNMSGSCPQIHLRSSIYPNQELGKSTYLRQTGLLVVMAMCGSFVPAEYASFRIHDSLLSRLSDDDDLEKNLSTFASEMASSAMVIGLVSSQSLVLIDELGRGTSPQEGVGIAHAIAERLIMSKCFVFFASHFQELLVTLGTHPSVVNLYLAVQHSRRSENNLGLTFQYRYLWQFFFWELDHNALLTSSILNGVSSKLDHYGMHNE